MLPPSVAILVAVAAGAIIVDGQAAQADTAQTFVDLQNAARGEVGVAPLAWDDTVAAYAAKRKGDCALVHSGGAYGENIFWGSTGGNWTAADAVSSWVQEKQYYDCGNNACAADQVCKHYTQVVWGSTTKLGCAAVACDGVLGTFIVCEYDPPGNLAGQRPYDSCAGQFNRSAQDSPQDFLSLQNAFRAGLGVGMLSWDSTLAAYAESYADKRKKDCQKTPSGGRYGENLFQGSAGSGASDALFSWFGERQNYNCSSNSCDDGDAFGDYTQLVWANSTRVGCASITCDASGTFI